ncbi:MAG TPA: hypothetical protein DCX54_00400 [Flavobacteriales bacterium]|nr:hypothetical protein [Flavobacteriales bacterium]
MNPILRNILAVIAGLILGSAVNMGIIMISGFIIPPPEGADVTTMEGLTASMHLFEPRHFLMPFLAHALGTLIGAYIAALIAISHHFRLAMVVGVFFIVGGIMNVFMLPSPMWFNVTDIALAYIPMAWIGCKLAGK